MDKTRQHHRISYPNAFLFEQSFPADDVYVWVRKNWTLTIYIGAAYVMLIFYGQHVMRNKPRFQLRLPLVVWNAFLTVLSVFGTIRTLPELLFLYVNFGYRRTICEEGYVLHSPVCSLWTFVFIVLKIVELGDTAFIVLRKQQLTFLHWFHHLTALLSVWYSFGLAFGGGRWTVVMNYIVHSFMYFYYGLKACRIRVPKLASMCLTLLQIVQFVFGFCAASIIIMILLRGEPCHATLPNACICASVYISNFVLFLDYFKKAYLSSPAVKMRDKKLS